MNNSEVNLIKDAQAGNRNALSRLVKENSSKVYNLALRLMRNEEDAEDVLQETFIIMMQKMHTFTGNSSLYTWLYRIATNVALGKLRSKKYIDTNVSIHDPDFKTLRGNELRDWPEHLQDKIGNEEFNDCLKLAMKKLPEMYRMVFVLRDLEGFSTKESANILHVSPSNVKIRLMRARLFLRDQLAHHLKCVEVYP